MKPQVTKDDPTALFWNIAEQLLVDENISKGTLMGFPCLRVNGDFFATADHRTGDLIVKLSKNRVQQLIKEGIGQPFAPAGRTFREWVLVAEHDTRSWKNLMQEAKIFVEGNG